MGVHVETVMPHQAFRTVGRHVADSLAMQLDARELRRFSAALHSVAHCLDAGLTNRGATKGTEWALGGAIADHIVPGDAIVIFSDAHPGRGFAAAHVTVRRIEEAIALGAGRAQIPQARATARRVSLRVAARRDGVVADPDPTHSDLIALAAHLLDAAAIRMLTTMHDGVPVLAIIGDTRTVGTTSGRFFASIMRLPGDWFGTSHTSGAVGHA